MEITKNKTAGFTVSELLITMTIGTVVAVVTMVMFMSFFSSTMRSHAETNLVLEAQIINRVVAEDLRISTKITTTNEVVDSNAPAGGWNTSASNHIIIISTPSEDANGKFIIDELEGGIYRDNVVYFNEGGELYKRVLANSNATGNVAVTTCPPSQVTPSCPRDNLMSDKFDDMNFEFFDQNGNSTTVLNEARSIYITVNLGESVFGQTISATNNLRMTLRNPT